MVQGSSQKAEIENNSGAPVVSGPGDYPEFISPPPWVPVWLPIQFLDRTKDDTYLVRVEDGKGRAYIDKAYFADDEGVWYEGNGTRDPYIGVAFDHTERFDWKVTAFAKWPNAKDIVVGHASDCATSGTPAFPAGPCDCGAHLNSVTSSTDSRDGSLCDSSLNNSSVSS